MERYPFFPMFVDLSCRQILVAGAGRIAARRIRTLLQFAPEVTVIAPEAAAEVEELAREGKVRLKKRPFQMKDLENAELVVLATDDAQLNAAAARECRRRGIPVNVSSDKEACDFYFPGIARRGNAVAGVTCSGQDHTAAKELTRKIQDLLDAQAAQ